MSFQGPNGGARGAVPKTLLAATGLLETATGVALIAAPSFVCGALVGLPLETGAGQTVGRVAGIALVTLGAACWFSRALPSDHIKALAGAMVFYNLAVALVLLHSRMESGTAGFAFWPAVLVHVAMGIWCISSLLPRRLTEG
jgi:hypothetical protein